MLLKKKKSALVLERERGGHTQLLAKSVVTPGMNLSLPPQLPAALALCF